MIKDLIKGDHSRYWNENPEKKWLFDIVSNHTSSFDLDKLDYLNRDLLHTRINQSQIDYERIIQHSRIIGNQIAYNKKVFSDINIVFARRQELFRQVYLHKTSQAIELMVADALIKANPYYRFDEVIF